MIARLALATTLASALVACGGPAHPAPAAAPTNEPPAGAAAPAAPTADSILEAYVEATGGRDARKGLTSLRGRGHISFAQIGLQGEVVILQAAPRSSRMRMELPGIGVVETGVTDGVVWEHSALTGARIKDGAERASALRDAELHAELHWHDTYAKVALAGEVEYEGRPAWKIVKTTADGEVKTEYYDRETHLGLGSEEVTKTQAGDLAARTHIVGYATFGPVLMAKTVVMSAQGTEIEMTIDEVEWNPALPADAFALPPAVAALIKRP